jgi:hypothetical protein
VVNIKNSYQRLHVAEQALDVVSQCNHIGLWCNIGLACPELH